MAPKILVVDDEPDIIAGIQGILEDSDYDVLSARNGAEALERVRVEKPSLIILDVLMPEMTGYEFVKNLRNSAAAEARPPVLVMSARPSMEQFFDPWEIHGFLTKPFSPEDLTARVAKAMTGRSGLTQKSAPVPPGSEKGGALILGVEDYVVRKLKGVLELKGYSTELALSERELCELAGIRKPDFVLIQFWEDPAILDASMCAGMFGRQAALSEVKVWIFCPAALGVDAQKHFAARQILTYTHTGELIEKLERAVFEAPGSAGAGH